MGSGAKGSGRREGGERVRERDRDRGGAALSRAEPGSIRVSNMPRNLDKRDIKEAFSDLGRVTRCEVMDGIASITFADPANAKKAVKTFDQGEMNGKTISVVIVG